jgi:serine/threonine protein kinase
MCIEAVSDNPSMNMNMNEEVYEEVNFGDDRPATAAAAAATAATATTATTATAATTAAATAAATATATTSCACPKISAGTALYEQIKIFKGKSRLTRFDDHIYNVPWSSIRKKCLLGQGAFSQVYKVQVELLKAPSNNDNGNNNNNNNNDNFSQDESERSSNDNDYDDSESISQSQSQRLVLPTSTCKRSSSSSSLLSLLKRSSSTASLLSLSGSSATGTNSTRKYYAIKHIKTSITQNETEVFDIAAVDLAVEGELLSRLRHDNIIKLHGIYDGNIQTAYTDHTNGYFLIMDVLDDTLTRRLRIARRSVSKKKRRRSSSWMNSNMTNMIQNVAIGIAKGLEYLHSNGVVLRDLKVRYYVLLCNVMLCCVMLLYVVLSSVLFCSNIK